MDEEVWEGEEEDEQARDCAGPGDGGTRVS